MENLQIIYFLCRTCQKEDHEGVCDMFKNEDEEAARHFIENKMTEALVRWVLYYIDLSTC